MGNKIKSAKNKGNLKILKNQNSNQPAPVEAPLTPKQKAMLDFIQEHNALKGYSPSQKEIATHFGFSSLGTVQNYLVRLVRGGFLQNSWNAKRAITLAEKTSSLYSHNHEASYRDSSNDGFSLPLLGRVAAGYPIEAIENPVSVEVPRTLIKQRGSNYFVLEVQGDSMIEDGILEGDHVIIRKTNHANAGDIVVALIDNEATIKRLQYTIDGDIELHPANPRFKPIRLRPGQDFRIQGVFSGLIRKGS